MTFNEQMQWAAMIAWKRINPGLSSLFFNLPLIVKNVEDVLKVVEGYSVLWFSKTLRRQSRY